MLVRPPADCHIQVGSQALVNGSQGARRPFGAEVVEVAGMKQASGRGEHTRALERASGDREGFWSWAPCIGARGAGAVLHEAPLLADWLSKWQAPQHV